jgi:hypothetical protein
MFTNRPAHMEQLRSDRRVALVTGGGRGFRHKFGATRGGLTFIAAAQDNYLRAFDSSTDKQLWQGRLPAAGNATPMTYTSPRGRQFVVIAAGGSSVLQTKRGDYVIALCAARITATRQGLVKSSCGVGK